MPGPSRRRSRPPRDARPGLRQIADPTHLSRQRRAIDGPRTLPFQEGATMTDEGTEPRTCPWCSTPAADEATTCSSCGAALAQRESLGGVQIPGLTTVDPGLAAFDAQPTHLTGPSSSQAVGHVALSAPGLGAPDELDAVGRPSEVALRALEQVESGGSTPADEGDEAPDPWRDLPEE